MTDLSQVKTDSTTKNFVVGVLGSIVAGIIMAFFDFSSFIRNVWNRLSESSLDIIQN